MKLTNINITINKYEEIKTKNFFFYENWAIFRAEHSINQEIKKGFLFQTELKGETHLAILSGAGFSKLTTSLVNVLLKF